MWNVDGNHGNLSYFRNSTHLHTRPELCDGADINHMWNWLWAAFQTLLLLIIRSQKQERLVNQASSEQFCAQSKVITAQRMFTSHNSWTLALSFCVSCLLAYSHRFLLFKPFAAVCEVTEYYCLHRKMFSAFSPSFIVQGENYLAVRLACCICLLLTGLTGLPTGTCQTWGEHVNSHSKTSYMVKESCPCRHW